MNAETHRKPFQLRVYSKALDKVKNWGYFATADEAALAYARRVGPEASAREARPGMTAEEALAAADVEGLMLEKRPPRNAGTGAGTGTGVAYKHVFLEGSSRKKYRLTIKNGGRGGGRTVKSGSFETAEEAALEAARYFRDQARQRVQNVE